jgi:hypothetical protein
MTPRIGRRLRLVAAVVGLLVAAGCTTTVNGKAAERSSPGRPTADSTSGSTPTGAADIVSVKYRIPAGFVENDTYQPLTPLESKRVSHFFPLATARNGRDVLSLTLYTLPAPHLVDTAANQLARINGYNRKTDATLYGKITQTSIAGLPAYTEVAEEPGGYTYGAFYVFGGKHLLQIVCQYSKQPKKVTTGCTSLIQSVVIG